jgi:hypothetical protein
MGAHRDPERNYICYRNLKTIYNELTIKFKDQKIDNLSEEDVHAIVIKYCTHPCNYTWTSNRVSYKNMNVLIVCNTHEDSVGLWKRGIAMRILLSNGDIYLLQSRQTKYLVRKTPP